MVDTNVSFSVSYVATSLPKNDELEVKTPVVNNAKTQRIQEFHQRYIENNSVVSLPRIDEMAQQFEMSVSAFKNIYKQVYGKTIYQSFLEKRMEYGTILLRKGYKISEVSKMIGYGKHSAIKFNKMFQRYFGMTPKKYQLTY